jgi:hypothetical protein
VDARIFRFRFVPVTPGDYNASWAVEQPDLDVVLLNWGADALTLFLQLGRSLVDEAALDGVLLN